MTTPDQHHTPTESNPHPPTEPGRADRPPVVDETYQTVAETVGGVPSLRLRDNLAQAVIIGVLVVIAAPVGFFIDGLFGLLVGTVVGLFVGLIISGTLLMVLGWIRLAKRKQSRR